MVAADRCVGAEPGPGPGSGTGYRVRVGAGNCLTEVSQQLWRRSRLEVCASGGCRCSRRHGSIVGSRPGRMGSSSLGMAARLGAGQPDHPHVIPTERSERRDPVTETWPVWRRDRSSTHWAGGAGSVDGIRLRLWLRRDRSLDSPRLPRDDVVGIEALSKRVGAFIHRRIERSRRPARSRHAP